MDRFNFFSRRPNNTTDTTNTTTANQTAPAPPQPTAVPVETYSPYDYSDDDDDYEDDIYDDDRAPLSPRYNSHGQPNREMSERPAAQQPSAFSRLSSYLRPSQGFFFRPASSNYSGAGLNGAPAETIVGVNPTRRHQPYTYGGPDLGVDSPKSPNFRIGAQNLPSTRLHLPNLDRTWTLGSNGPPSRDGPAQAQVPAIQEPQPAVVSERDQRRRRERRHRREGDGNSGRRRHRREGSGSRREGSGSGSRREGGSGSRREGGSGSGSGSRREGGASQAERSERRERRRRRHAESSSNSNSNDAAATTGTSRSSRSSGSRSSRRGPPPRNFLFCFPWVQSRRIRSQILKCFVSGIFLASILTVYLALTLTNNIKSSEFTILLVLIILAIAIFFCHSLIRLCMLVHKGNKKKAGARGDLESGTAAAGTQSMQQVRGGGGLLPDMQPPAQFGGYAVPREPIRVVLASDEDAVGIESAATKLSPPAYGLWRESVRVDPNRLYWQRNGAAEDSNEDLTSSISSSNGGSRVSEQNPSGTRPNVPRPPSYSSDDGVSYVVEARPRSTLPPLHAAGPHPAEAGRVGQPPAWV